MKLIADLMSNEILLEVATTAEGDATKDFYFPKMNIHFWYPFNINFFYKFTESKKFLYLSTEKGYDGVNYYNTDVLKRTKPLAQRNGVMFHPGVYHRNKLIIEKARALNIPTVIDQYTAEDVQAGFNIVSDCMSLIKERIENRYIEKQEGVEDFQSLPDERWDAEIYSEMTEEEQEALNELGEMYVMLNLMRKLAEGR